MCGIVGYVGKDKKAINVLINGLKNLEYRGYDSAGIAYYNGSELKIVKEKGKIVNLEKLIKMEDSSLGIGHTRWATHGEATRINSHPHKVGKITLVHNGIIENYADLKEELIRLGYEFKSQTDTEVACALIDYLYSKFHDLLKSINEFQKRVRGAYALVIISDDDYNSLYIAKKDSPLIIGISENENYIASDVPAIIDYTNKYIDLNNGEYGIVQEHGIELYNVDGNKVTKDVLEFPRESYDISKNGYEHIMLKEIHEQPTVLKNTVNPYFENGIESLINKLPDFSKYNKICIVACGSAMHAGLVGKSLIEKFADVEVNVEIASEFRYKKVFIDSNTLVIGVSQSGETADTLKAIEKAKSIGADTLGIISKKGSSIARIVDYLLYTESGIEVAVATTKAYSCQVSLFSLIALKIAIQKDIINKDEFNLILENIKYLPIDIEKMLNNDNLNIYKSIASYLYDKNDIFFIGRGIDYSLCMEGSLKLKEISYIHSEAYAAGELKHGTISLIEPGTPVVAVITDEEIAEKTFSNLVETKARGSHNFIITTESLDRKFIENEVYLESTKVIIPNEHALFQALVTVIPLQLIAYETAKLKGEEIDTPRNLAKSVTVE